MKAKTTKFLAVLAVLAMAFAGVAVLAQEQTDVADAAAQEGATEKAEGHNVSLKIGDSALKYYTTTAEAFKTVTTTDAATITLLASHSGAGLQSPAANQGVNVTIDFAGFTYTVNKPVGSSGTENSGAQLLKGNTYTFENGTLSVAAKTGEKDGKCYVINNYAALTLTNMVIDGTNLAERVEPICNDPLFDGENTVTIALWMQNGVVTINGSTTVITGTAGDNNYGLAVNYWPASYSDGAKVTLNTTGEINGILMALDSGTPTDANISTLTIDNAKIYGDVYTYKSMPANKFTITNATIPEGKTLSINGAMTIANNENASIEIAEGSDMTFAQGSTITQNLKVSFTRYVVDKYTFTNGANVKAGVGGFTIAPGENGFELSGNIDGAPNWKFKGAASYTGIIDAKTAAVTIEADANYDFTFKSATIYTTAGLNLTKGAAVADDAVVQINEGLTVGKGSLKIGDGAYVRVYGEVALDDASKVYSAGNVVADTMKIGNNSVVSPDVLPYQTITGVYVYKDGSIKVSDKELTNLEEVRMAYVYQTGAGMLGINGITVINNDYAITGDVRTGGYYKYSCMVFYPVAVQDVLNLKAQSGIVKGIETDADLTSEPDINYDLQYAKYKINYETRTPTFVIEYIETYKVTLTDVITKYTIADSAGLPVHIASDDGTTLYAKLIYGETYSLNGKVKDNKYTYESTINTNIETKQVLNYVSPILTTFEQTRMEQTISVKVGLGMTVYVQMTNNDPEDPAVAVGDKILTYSVDGEEFDVYAENIEAKLNGSTVSKFLGGVFKVYNTDRILVKLDDKEFFTEVLKDDGYTELEKKAITVEEGKAGWKYALEAKTPGDVKQGDNKPSQLGIMTAEYALDKLIDSYKLSNIDGVTGPIIVTLDFENYYPGKSGHAKTIEITMGETTATTTGLPTTFFIGETYTMAWEDVDGVKYKMTYPDSKEPAKTLTYEEGTLVEVKNTAAANATAAGTEYTLQLTKIRYADIENKTNLDLIVTYGDSEITIKKGEKRTGENGLPLDAYYPANAQAVADLKYNDYYLVLSAKGYAISSWTGKYMKNSTAAETDATAITGSGPSSTSKLNELVDGGKIIITSIQATQNLYQVMVDDQQRPYVGEDYTRTGHYNDKMYLFPTAESGKTVYDINVYLADPTKPDLKGDFWCTATESEDGKYSYYYMPDSDVVLEVIVDQSTYNVNFVDQDGTPVGETIPVEPYSVHTLAIPAKFGYVATDAEIVGDIEGDFEFDPDTQTVTFDMPNRNVVITVTYDEGGPYSDDMEIFVSKATDGVKITIISNKDLPIQSGYLAIRYYVLVEEDGIYGLMPVDMKPVIEFTTSGVGIIESTTVSLAGEESYDAIYYVSATYETLGGEVLKSDTLAYKM